jgi:hypothetical protein
MRAHAARVNGLLPSPPLGAFVAAQTWLQLAGERRVFIPYAEALADLVPSHHVRMRRDFRQLLTVIETIAVLYQCQRERDADGRILAEIEDYVLARRLLREVFQTVATGGVTRPVRETVQAVERLYDGEHLTKQQVANQLKIAKDTAWYRLNRAIALGYVVNDELGKGRPAKLRPGDPLPEERPALPSVAEVWACVQNFSDVDSTIQPDGASESADATEAVETWVESGIQPAIQPRREGESDSYVSPSSYQVEGLNADPGAAHNTRDSEMEEVRI